MNVNSDFRINSDSDYDVDSDTYTDFPMGYFKVAAADFVLSNRNEPYSLEYSLNPIEHTTHKGVCVVLERFDDFNDYFVKVSEVQTHDSNGRFYAITCRNPGRFASVLETCRRLVELPIFEMRQQLSDWFRIQKNFVKLGEFCNDASVQYGVCFKGPYLFLGYICMKCYIEETDVKTTAKTDEKTDEKATAKAVTTFNMSHSVQVQLRENVENHQLTVVLNHLAFGEYREIDIETLEEFLDIIRQLKELYTSQDGHRNPELECKIQENLQRELKEAEEDLSMAKADLQLASHLLAVDRNSSEKTVDATKKICEGRLNLSEAQFKLDQIKKRMASH